MKELTSGGANIVAELVGHPAALTEGIQMVRPEGRYLVIGNISAKHTIEFNPAWLVHLNRSMVGVAGYQAWALKRGLQFLERNHSAYPLEKILSDIKPLESINEAFQNAESSGAIRTGLICAPDLVQL